MRFLCVVELLVTLNTVNMECCTVGLLRRIYVVGDYKTHLGLHVKCSIILSDFDQIWIFSSDFSYKAPISNFTEIRLRGVALVYTDRRTGMTKLIGSFSDCANAPKTDILLEDVHKFFRRAFRT